MALLLWTTGLKVLALPHAEVYVWGRGEYGRLGLGDRTGSSKLRPQKVSSEVQAAGWPPVRRWDLCRAQLLGTVGHPQPILQGISPACPALTYACPASPPQVKALEGHRVVQGSCGGTHTMVVTDEGRCFIWGRAAFGRCAYAGVAAGGCMAS